MTGVTGCEGCLASSNDASDLDVADLDRPPDLPLPGSDPRRGFRAVRSKDSTRAPRISSMAISKASGSLSRRRPGARSARPKRISKTVIVVVQTDSGDCASNHRATAGSTEIRITADRTLV